MTFEPIAVTARSTAWVCGRSFVGFEGWDLARGMDVVCRECCALSDRGLSDGPISSPEVSYRTWRVCV
jgi:hypothetical protein